MNMSNNGLIKTQSRGYEKKFSMRDEIFQKISNYHSKKPNSHTVSSNENCVVNNNSFPDENSTIDSLSDDTFSRKLYIKRKDVDAQDNEKTLKPNKIKKKSSSIQSVMKIDEQSISFEKKKPSQSQGFILFNKKRMGSFETIPLQPSFPSQKGVIETVDDIESFSDDDIQDNDTSPPNEPFKTNDNNTEHFNSEMKIPEYIDSKLFDYQREGANFLYSLYIQNKGGILADDMGMGKTIQIISFASSVLGGKNTDILSYFSKNEKYLDNQTSSSDTPNPIIIVSPASILHQWFREFSHWSKLRIAIAMGKERHSVIANAGLHKLDVVIISYDTFKTLFKQINEVEWSFIVFDEVHKIKNRTSQISKLCKKLKVIRRYGLTGTMMQNSFEELWNLCDVLGCAAQNLGDLDYFKKVYAIPIKEGHMQDASAAQIQRGLIAAKSLAEKLKRFTLRRTKSLLISKNLPAKEDHIVFCSMTPLQTLVYQKLLDSPFYKYLRENSIRASPCSCGSGLPNKKCCGKFTSVSSNLINSKKLLLPAIIKLQQISNHIEMITSDDKKLNNNVDIKSMVLGESQSKPNFNDSFLEKLLSKDYEILKKCIESGDDIALSGKLNVLNNLLPRWRDEDSKILIFTSSTRMMDILERFLTSLSFSYGRIDGSTSIKSRQRRVDMFNRTKNQTVMIMSTKACGLGLNLSSANIVVIFEPNWNVTHDLQAMDRAHRIGQQKVTRVYRLISASTVEELTYRRQIYKQQIANIATEGKKERRIFKYGEVFGAHLLFTYTENDSIQTMEIIERSESDYRIVKSSLKEEENNSEQDPIYDLILSKAKDEDDVLDNIGDDLDSTEDDNCNLDSQVEIERLMKEAGVIHTHLSSDILSNT